MALFIQISTFSPHSTTGVDPSAAFMNLANITGNVGLGTNAVSATLEQVVLPVMASPAPAALVSSLVNNSYFVTGVAMPVDTLLVPVLNSFVFGTAPIKTLGGVTMAPAGSGMLGAGLGSGTTTNPMLGVVNPTDKCVIFYDTSENNNAGYCVAQGGQHNLRTPSYVLLYHEFSHAWRILQNNQLPTSPNCNPASMEEKAAIQDENVLRLQKSLGTRDPFDACVQTCPNIGPPPPPPPCCCIIASVASGSAQSPVVEELRALRDGFVRKSEIGFAFFETLFYDYYAFSPQVCTMMARDRSLPGIALEGFVRPLLIMLRTMKALLQEGFSDDSIGLFFFEETGSAAEREESLASVERAGRFWRGEEMPDNAIAKDLAELLRERAWSSDHVRWGLVEPAQMYGRMLELAKSNGDAAALGRELRHIVDRWAAELPIDHIWASMPSLELAKELSVLETALLHSEWSRSHFRTRLKRRFGSIPPIANLLGSSALEGGACGERIQ